MTPQDALAVIGQSKLLLGMRLHSLIYAADLGVPMVPIVYQDKVAGLAQMLGAEAVHVDTMDADALWRLVQPALDGRAKTAGALQMQEKEQQRVYSPSSPAALPLPGGMGRLPADLSRVPAGGIAVFEIGHLENLLARGALL